MGEKRLHITDNVRYKVWRNSSKWSHFRILRTKRMSLKNWEDTNNLGKFWWIQYIFCEEWGQNSTHSDANSHLYQQAHENTSLDSSTITTTTTTVQTVLFINRQDLTFIRSSLTYHLLQKVFTALLWLNWHLSLYFQVFLPHCRT